MHHLIYIILVFSVLIANAQGHPKLGQFGPANKLNMAAASDESLSSRLLQTDMYNRVGQTHKFETSVRHKITNLLHHIEQTKTKTSLLRTTTLHSLLTKQKAQHDQIQEVEESLTSEIKSTSLNIISRMEKASTKELKSIQDELNLLRETAKGNRKEIGKGAKELAQSAIESLISKLLGAAVNTAKKLEE